MAITEYKYIRAQGLDRFNDAVNAAIGDGFQPKGNTTLFDGKEYGIAMQKGSSDIDDFDPGAAVSDAIDDTDVVAQVNALLASLRAAGLIAAE